MFLANKQKKTQDEEKKKPDPSSAAEKTNGCTASESGSGSGNSVLGVLKNGGAKSQQGTPPAVRRVMTDKEHMDLRFLEGGADEQVQVHWPDINNLLKFEVIVKPKKGYYKGGTFRFDVRVPNSYPHDPPKVVLKEETKVYHPNINFDGAVCLNLLRKEWKPVYTLENVIIGLEFLFLNPEGNDPLNHEVAKIFRENPARFEANVRRAMRGQRVDGEDFPNVLSE